MITSFESNNCIIGYFEWKSPNQKSKYLLWRTNTCRKYAAKGRKDSQSDVAKVKTDQRDVNTIYFLYNLQRPAVIAATK